MSVLENTSDRSTISLKNMMRGLIDYAGLFPPAQLELQEAVPNFYEYAKSRYSWMLTNFVIPVGQLKNLSSLIPESDVVMPLTIICRRATTKEELLQSVKEDIDNTADFTSSHNGKFLLSSFEIALTSDLQDLSTSELDEYLKSMLSLNCSKKHKMYIEVPPVEQWELFANSVIASLQKHNDNDPHSRFAFKLRCGGVTKGAFPSVERVAQAMVWCTERKVAMKCTAGLHHPIRHFNDSVETKMHGFINVFFAKFCSLKYSLDSVVIAEILNEERSDRFTFSDESIQWKEYCVTADEVTSYRKDVHSYGSCSFIEPIEDLQNLELL